MEFLFSRDRPVTLYTYICWLHKYYLGRNKLLEFREQKEIEENVERKRERRVEGAFTTTGWM
jgi:hypothetical protein